MFSAGDIIGVILVAIFAVGLTLLGMEDVKQTNQRRTECINMCEGARYEDLEGGLDKCWCQVGEKWELKKVW